MATVKITDNRFEQEFVAETEGRRAVAAYQLEDGVMTFTHTIVPKAVEVVNTLSRGSPPFPKHFPVVALHPFSLPGRRQQVTPEP